MFIKIGKTTEEAMNVLGLKQYPFTSKDLITCFRTSAKINHPDNGGKHENMVIVIDSYKALKHLVVNSMEKGVSYFEELESEDIFDMFEDRECGNCQGTKKVFKYTSVFKRPCPKCHGSGKARLKCRFCNDGKFTLRSGKIVRCRSCHGTGLFEPRCNMCSGRGVFGIGNSYGFGFYEQESVEVTCPFCKGKGIIRTKIKPFNPVIPKGAVL